MDHPSITNDYTPDDWLKLALKEATKCIPAPQAFNVGSLILSSSNRLLSTGYSRELPGNTHAEQNAITKLTTQALPEETLKMVVTMEPCSTRLSGNLSCCNSILKWNQENPKNMILEILIGVLEPKDLVICNGLNILKEHGIKVSLVNGFEDECLKIARKK